MYTEYAGTTVHRFALELRDGTHDRMVLRYMSDESAVKARDALAETGKYAAVSVSRVTVPADYPQTGVTYRAL